jgi:IS30 family transposase
LKKGVFKYTIILRLTGECVVLLVAAVSYMTDIKEKVKMITFDNGLEFAEHKYISRGLEADIYFAHPYRSWERDINDNKKGLIRQYFPKGTDFNELTDKQVQRAMDRLNNRPPNELFMGLQVNLLAAKSNYTYYLKTAYK